MGLGPERQAEAEADGRGANHEEAFPLRSSTRSAPEISPPGASPPSGHPGVSARLTMGILNWRGSESAALEGSSQNRPHPLSPLCPGRGRRPGSAPSVHRSAWPGQLTVSAGLTGPSCGAAGSSVAPSGLSGGSRTTVPCLDTSSGARGLELCPGRGPNSRPQEYERIRVQCRVVQGRMGVVRVVPIRRGWSPQGGGGEDTGWRDWHQCSGGAPALHTPREAPWSLWAAPRPWDPGEMGFSCSASAQTASSLWSPSSPHRRLAGPPACIPPGPGLPAARGPHHAQLR